MRWQVLLFDVVCGVCGETWFTTDCRVPRGTPCPECEGDG